MSFSHFKCAYKSNSVLNYLVTEKNSGYNFTHNILSVLSSRIKLMTFNTNSSRQKLVNIWVFIKTIA